MYIARFLSSTLLPFSFWGLLTKAEYWKHGTHIFKGLLGDLDRVTCIFSMLAL